MLLTRLLCVDVTNQPIGCGLHDSCERKYAKQVSSCCNIRKRLQSLPHYAETLLVRTHVHMLFAKCYSEKQKYKRAIIGYVCSVKRYTLRMGVGNESEMRLGESYRKSEPYRESNPGHSAIKVHEHNVVRRINTITHAK